MKIKLLRYHDVEGRRETDKGAEVAWNLAFDNKNKRLIIKTENAKYQLIWGDK